GVSGAKVSAGAGVALGAVRVWGALVLPAASVAVAEKVMVPSARLVTSMVTVQAPPVPPVVDAFSVVVPSLAVMAMVAPSSAVPETVTLAWLAALIGLVTVGWVSFA